MEEQSGGGGWQLGQDTFFGMSASMQMFKYDSKKSMCNIWNLCLYLCKICPDIHLSFTHDMT